MKFYEPPMEFEPEKNRPLVDEFWEGREVTLITDSGVGTYRVGKVTPSYDHGDDTFTVSVRIDDDNE